MKMNFNKSLVLKVVKLLLIVLIFMFLVLYIWINNTTFDNRFSPVVYSQEGEIMSAHVSKDQQWRISCSGELPIKFATSIRLFEDQYFYYHPGVNIGSLFNAFKQNIKAGKIVRGGSTLTMQLARIYFGNAKRTYFQKIKEIFFALAIETKYSKDEILKLYGQYAPFGGNIIGYCAASRFYYDKDPSLLSWSESVTLAVLPNAPSDIYPGKGQLNLIRKRDRLLEKLLRKRIIDSVTYRLSLKESVPVQKNNFPSLSPHLIPYFTMKHKDNVIGNKYITTIDMSLQKGVKKVVDQYAKRYSARGIDNMAVLILRNDGTVASYIANSTCQTKDCGSSVDIIKSYRSPGSILKPFLYGMSLDGGLITRKSLINDIPIFYNGFSPKNYDRRFRGIISAEDALTQSLNVPAVNLLSDYGIDAFLNGLVDLGFKGINKDAGHYGLSLILGGCEVSMMEVGQAYMNLVRKAMKKEALSISLIKEEKPQRLNEIYPVSTAASWTVLDILKGVNRPVEQDGWQYFTNQHSISWKTGTSYGYRDAWSVGVNKDYTVVVWVGNADGEGRKGLTGIKKAAPVLFSVFDLLPLSEKIEEPINRFKQKKVCKVSGYSATSACNETEIVFVPDNSHNLPQCKFHKILTVDIEEKFQVNNECKTVKEFKQKSYFVLSPIVNSYFKKFSGKDFLVPPMHPDCSSFKERIDIVYPPHEAILLLPNDIDRKKRKLICSASTSPGIDSLYWFFDDDLISITKGNHKLEIDAEIGNHKITILSPNGSSVTHSFYVKK